jgi:hypothetical protein
MLLIVSNSMQGPAHDETKLAFSFSSARKFKLRSLPNVNKFRNVLKEILKWALGLIIFHLAGKLSN